MSAEGGISDYTGGGTSTCNCPFWRKYHILCRHIWAVLLVYRKNLVSNTSMSRDADLNKKFYEHFFHKAYLLSSHKKAAEALKLVHLYRPNINIKAIEEFMSECKNEKGIGTARRSTTDVLLPAPNCSLKEFKDSEESKKGGKKSNNKRYKSSGSLPGDGGKSCRKKKRKTKTVVGTNALKSDVAPCKSINDVNTASARELSKRVLPLMFGSARI